MNKKALTVPELVIAIVVVAIILLCIFFAIAPFTGNKDVIDLNYNFDYAIIQLQNGKVIEGKIKSWRDYEDGEQLQVVMEDGKTYLTNSYNCTLIKGN